MSDKADDREEEEDMSAPVGNTFAAGLTNSGRPSKYKEEYIKIAYMACLAGFDDEGLADLFQVHIDTIYDWRIKYEEFSDACRDGKDIADIKVANSLYQGTQDREIIEEQAIKVKIGQFEEEVQIVEVKKIIPGDFRNQQYWMKNRKPKQWRDKQEIDVQGGFALIINEKDAKADD